MRAPEQYEPYEQLIELPDHLKAPTWIYVCAVLAVLSGLLLGLNHEARVPAESLIRCLFFSSAFLYLLMSLIDFYEHFRIEKILTGSYLGTTFVPLGETINHAITSTCVVLLFVLARPLRFPLEPRDYVLLALPGIFLFFGIRDELVYHRRRSYHREDILHTISHLSAGVMLATYLCAALIDWQKLA